jgi:riboflavin kinase / FMN adenylyltransferase
MNQTQARDRAVVAIGIFDGVHKGHQELFARVRRAADREGSRSGVATFDPPPYGLLSGNPAPLEITPLREKIILLAELGIDRVLVVPFTRPMAGLPPERFVDEVLLSEFDLAGVVVGHDFRFGANRSGDSDLLRALGAARGFPVEVVAPVEQGGTRVSSTRLRESIASGRVEEAAGLTGRVFTIAGRVVRGRGLGTRQLVPTANLEVDPRQLLPGPGVYAVEVQTPSGRFAGAANVGRTPTLDAGHDRLIEVHLLDFEGDLLDALLSVGFLARLREEKTFSGLKALRAAIAQDIQAVRERLGRRPGRGRQEPQNRLAASGSV